MVETPCRRGVPGRGGSYSPLRGFGGIPRGGAIRGIEDRGRIVVCGRLHATGTGGGGDCAGEVGVLLGRHLTVVVNVFGLPASGDDGGGRATRLRGRGRMLGDGEGC